MNKTIALVTGASSGLGFETSLMLAEKGFQVYATMRNLENQMNLKIEATKRNVDLTILELDVTKLDSIKSAVEFIIQEEGRIDILINNAGAGFNKTTEQATDEEINWQLNLNLMGVIRMTKAVLPIMRSQREGRVINISSVGGLVGQPFNEIYCAAKFGVEGYTESLTSYIQPEFNIKFTIIEPGGIQSEFMPNIMNHLTQTGGIQEDEYTHLYNSYVSDIKENYGHDASQSTHEVAQVILKTIEMKEPPIRTRTSDWSETFTNIKIKLDPDGKQQQKQVYKLLGK